MPNSDKAAAFRALHHDEPVLVLANAWDVASALLVERAGATAVATTSAGVAWSLGAPDGDQLDRNRAIELVARVAGAVRVPVTADIESGFAAEPAGVGETVRMVIDAGAVGVNLEDAVGAGLRETADAAARIAAARQAADATGVSLYVNARVDTYLRAVGDPSTRLADTLARAAAYLTAGADGVFVPGVFDQDTISALTAGVAAPLNILAGPGSLSVAELGELGVARVSVGGLVALAAYAVTERIAGELFRTGTYASIDTTITHSDLNSLLGNRA